MDQPEARGRPAAGAGHYLRDIVYGALDGVITTLAVVAGAAGAAFGPRVGLVLGLANLVADGLSMGASNYLGLRSELEQAGRSVDDERPLRHGLATFVAFATFGAVPLLAYALPARSGEVTLVWALVFALIALVVAGAVRGALAGRAVTRSVLEMVALGAATSAAAYGISALARRWVA